MLKLWHGHRFLEITCIVYKAIRDNTVALIYVTELGSSFKPRMCTHADSGRRTKGRPVNRISAYHCVTGSVACILRGWHADTQTTEGS